MSKGTILVIGSNATQLEAKSGGTITIGQFLNETAVPLMALVAAGYDFVLATPTGEKPHVDKDSDALLYFANDNAARTSARDFFNDNPAMNDVRTIRSVIDAGLGSLRRPLLPRRSRPGRRRHARPRHPRGPAPLPHPRQAHRCDLSRADGHAGRDGQRSRVPRCADRRRPQPRRANWPRAGNTRDTG